MRRSSECVFLSILLLLEVVVVVEGCSCYQDPDPEKAFKNAGYVIRTVIVSEKKLVQMNRTERGRRASHSAYYISNVITTFKGEDMLKDELIKNGRNLTLNIFTGQYSSTCGAHLIKDEEYLLYGDVYKGKAIISSCDKMNFWESVNEDEKLVLSNRDEMKAMSDDVTGLMRDGTESANSKSIGIKLHLSGFLAQAIVSYSLLLLLL